MNISLKQKHHDLRIAQAHQLATILRDIDVEQPHDTPTRATAGGDKRRLRGIPVLANGVGSAIPGTNPLAALLTKERLRTTHHER